jgi:hypothetical protein
MPDKGPRMSPLTAIIDDRDNSDRMLSNNHLLRDIGEVKPEQDHDPDRRH